MSEWRDAGYPSATLSYAIGSRCSSGRVFIQRPGWDVFNASIARRTIRASNRTGTEDNVRSRLMKVSVILLLTEVNLSSGDLAVPAVCKLEGPIYRPMFWMFRLKRLQEKMKKATDDVPN